MSDLDAARMIDVEEGRQRVLAHVKPVSSVNLPLRDSLGLILAEPVTCDVDYPPFDRSVMDGYAVRSADVADSPVTLRVVGQIPAGVASDRRLGAGEAMQINTGAPMPPGADAVVRVEHTECGENNTVVILKGAAPGKFITPRATYVSAGRAVLQAGTRMTALEIGAAATAGAAHVTVHRRPTVAILATGDELVGIEEKPTGAKIRNSNEYLLEALIRSAEGTPVILGIAADDRASLEEKIRAGLDEDVLCITGGVSMGAFDFVPEVLDACGVAVYIRKMAIKPGRPVIFGTAKNGALVFALPGNPMSAFVTFELLVRPAMAALQGRTEAAPEAIAAVLFGSLPATTDRRTFLPGCASVNGDGRWEVRPLSWHGSGDPFGAATANAMLMRPPHAAAASTGDMVSVLLTDRA